jgi:hypothetical protein
MGRQAQRRRRGGQRTKAGTAPGPITLEDATWDTGLVTASFSANIAALNFVAHDFFVIHNGAAVYPSSVVHSGTSALIYDFTAVGESLEDDRAILANAPPGVFTPASVIVGT